MCRPTSSIAGTFTELVIVSDRNLEVYTAPIKEKSAEWLMALPVAECGLAIENEAVRVAVVLPSCSWFGLSNPYKVPIWRLDHHGSDGRRALVL